jgi:predicted metal-dependent TIM-barrel fold hydrolase
VAKEMRKKGFSAEKIEAVTFRNAYDFFRRSPKFTWQP